MTLHHVYTSHHTFQWPAKAGWGFRPGGLQVVWRKPGRFQWPAKAGWGFREYKLAYDPDTGKFQWPAKAGWGFRVPGRRARRGRGQVSMASKGRMGIQVSPISWA